ncbi:MAG: DNA polymerase domain-containing protein [Candidatus Aenigmatarchaeota archaeon]
MEIEMQILDCDYIMFGGKPLVRLFGKTREGEAVCALTNSTIPYFYVDAKNIDEAKAGIENEGKEFNARAEIIEKVLPIGYQKPKNILKITARDPGTVPDIKKIAAKYGAPYEADILFKYRYLVDSGFKGMNWVRVSGKPAHTSIVKCRAIDAEKIEPIEQSGIAGNAPLRYLSLDIECVADSDDRIPEAEKDGIVIISLCFFPDFKNKRTLVLSAKPLKTGTDVLACPDEKEMLKKFVEIVNEYNPDVVLGYNINNFDLPFIVKRLEVLNIPRDFGRTEKNVFCRKLALGHACSMVGRVVVDPYEIIKKDPWVKFKRYDLGTIATAMLGEGKMEMGGIREMRSLWNGNQEQIKKFIDYSRVDAELAMRLVIEKGLLDKFFELAKISGLLLQDALGGQSQRHECKLLHEFRKRNIVMPCRPDDSDVEKSEDEREDKGLKGAIVLEPIVGLHKDCSIIVLDFTSLYPSLIRTYNICPTTLLLENADGLDHFTSPDGVKFVKHEIREGVLPAILSELMEARAAAKKQLKTAATAEQKRLLDAKQLALKDMANSLYGYTGYMRARLYVMDVANSVTGYGRENIMKTKKIIEDTFHKTVTYGDTDSIFVKTDTTDLEEAEKEGIKISSFVTEELPGVLDLKFEKIYKTFLILTKKRYAGWKFERDSGGWKDKIEMKGIETVRRDWCSLTGETMLSVLNIILKEGDIQKAAKFMRSVIEDLSAGKIPLEKLTIIKGVSRSLGSYKGVQPHVELAKKIGKRDPTKAVIVGERLGYVIVKGNQLVSKRAEDPDYVREKGLEIDPQYYIENQMLPPIERIFEVCGVNKSELMEGNRQKKLFEMFGAKAAEVKSPEQTVLKGFDSIVCKKCDWSFRRVPLAGKCPKCGSQLLFQKDGSIGASVEMEN